MLQNEELNLSHTLAVPNNPLGLINKTNTTNKVANIFAKVGEKKLKLFHHSYL